MNRTVATLLVLFAVSPASLALATTTSGRPKVQAAPPTSVSAVLARAGIAGETTALRDLLDETVAPPDPAQAYADTRAAIRSCHAERYSTARHNVLTGRGQPLRTC